MSDRARGVEVVYTPDANTLAVGDFVVTLHVDMRPGNAHLVGGPLLALMKPTAILINTSRGKVLDTAARAAAIRGKRIAGAAIDVFDPEPPPADDPLLGLDNV